MSTTKGPKDVHGYGGSGGSGGSGASLRQPLGRLVELQQLQLDRRQAQLVAQQQLCQRVQGTVDRLEALGAHATLSGTQLPGLAQNSAAYKQAILAWADQQRQELVRRQAELAQARAETLAAARRQESLRLVLDRAEAGARREAQRQEQKRQDEIASRCTGLPGLWNARVASTSVASSAGASTSGAAAASASASAAAGSPVTRSAEATPVSVTGFKPQPVWVALVQGSLIDTLGGARHGD
ncbi:flagellar FliJ family protein [Roseateles amylovorans]|uniref:Flagellar FliJ protein n=1 Tax=Roseateles amylovorans TaxID=2978473 RepID=A0ABY6AWX2_9BURK|nr:flagellar FliJ family protein [Roseateles amylovorans]UXH76899.1 flagellar FliJ family protein [Roseateles amylovorans]